MWCMTPIHICCIGDDMCDVPQATHASHNNYKEVIKIFESLCPQKFPQLFPPCRWIYHLEFEFEPVLGNHPSHRGLLVLYMELAKV